ARLGVPVAAGKVRTGLSADGTTLVLAEPITSSWPAETTIALLSTDLKAAPRIYTLPGAFSVDAVSPAGRWVYLIQRRSQYDVFDSGVRAFAARSGRLLPGAIVDRREPGAMHGYPIDRTSTGRGQMAFTIYAGLGEHESFVHALDTVHRTARCLDLP